MNFLRRALLGILLTPMVLASACTSDNPRKPPAPAVSTAEFEHRLDEHLSRFASLLQPDAHVSAPAHSRVQGCAGGPSWSVVPRAEVTVQAGDQAGQLFEDLRDWMTRNGFDGLYDNGNLYPGNDWEVKGRHTDGTQAVEHLNNGASQFTVTVTGPCTWPPDRPGGPASGRLLPLPKPSKQVSIPSTGGTVDSKVCVSPKLYVYSDSAPAFAGQGPHLMVMSVYKNSPGFLYGDPGLPDGWEPGDKHKVQLVVCVRVSTNGHAGHKMSCSYGNPAFPGGGVPYDFEIFESVYQVTVRDARTGAAVQAFSLPGTLDDKKSCPFMLQKYVKPLARGLDDEALERALRPLYESTR